MTYVISSLFNNISWSIVSKAADKSRNDITHTFLWSSFSNMSDYTFNSAVSVLWRALYADRYILLRSFLSKWQNGIQCLFNKGSGDRIKVTWFGYRVINTFSNILITNFNKFWKTCPFKGFKLWWWAFSIESKTARTCWFFHWNCHACILCFPSLWHDNFFPKFLIFPSKASRKQRK